MKYYDKNKDYAKEGEHVLNQHYQAIFGSGAKKMMSRKVDYSLMPDDPVCYRDSVIRSMDIHLLPEQYDKLMEFIGWYSDHNIKDIEYGEYLQHKAEVKEQREKDLREQYPALKRAYDNYQTVLRMVDNKKK